jgi:hypothetical protein
MRIYPEQNCLTREAALRMWTENVAWFSNEEGAKGRIEVGQFADLIVPDRDYFFCPEHEIANTTSNLTMVGGKIVYAAGEFGSLDEGAPPPAMPDWSPVRTFGGYGGWGERRSNAGAVADHAFTGSSIARPCMIHGHQHGAPRSRGRSFADFSAFWGPSGCACWAF